MIYAAAAVQAVTCVVLGILFYRHGDPRLAIAQACYGVATIALFARG